MCTNFNVLKCFLVANYVFLQMHWTLLSLVIAGALASPVEEKAVAEAGSERDEKCEFLETKVKTNNCDNFTIFSVQRVPNCQI